MKKDTQKKRVRFQDITEEIRAPRKDPIESGDESIDDDEDLEKKKDKRGSVKLDGYQSDTDSETEKYNKKNLDHLDMFDDEQEDIGSKKSKKVKLINVEDIEGQEDGDEDYFKEENEGEVKIEAFNLKDDMEEGKFDENGNFVWNKKDPESIHDGWLQSIGKKEIEDARLAKEKKDLKEREINAKENELAQFTKEEIMVMIVNLLKPKESIITGLARLGKYNKKRGGRNKNKKNKKPEEEVELNEAERAEYQKQFEELTEYANHLMENGMLDIYQGTYESLVRNLRANEIIPDDWVHGDKLELK
ncbi:hypothetical protein K502DRAFT_331664 [Neoconidiobolus thromboides FSU 785]|nr:hypothetical protein K502DRAFT_331664 [Neoconidiobolus thromboides FSU 785]